jgi:hypothetical protein
MPGTRFAYRAFSFCRPIRCPSGPEYRGKKFQAGKSYLMTGQDALKKHIIFNGLYR